jgi:hypothetical protein
MLAVPGTDGEAADPLGAVATDCPAQSIENSRTKHKSFFVITKVTFDLELIPVNTSIRLELKSELSFPGTLYSQMSVFGAHPCARGIAGVSRTLRQSSA